MLTPDDYEDLKQTLIELDPDELLDVLKIDSTLLLEIVENYDFLLIEDAAEQVGHSSTSGTSTRSSLQRAGKQQRPKQ